MLDKQDRKVARKGVDQGDQTGALRRRGAGGGLVHKEDSRTGTERDRDLELPLLPVRQFSHVAMKAIDEIHALGSVHRLLDDGAERLFRAEQGAPRGMHRLAGDAEIFQDAEALEQHVLLERPR